MNQPIIGLNTCIMQAGDLVSCNLDGETALMSVDRGKYYGINPIGSRIWALIEQPRMISELCAVLLSEFEVESSQCENEVLAFLSELAQDNLVTVVDNPGA
jgi:hypothetical protein